MSFSSANTDWIWASKDGAALGSDEVSAEIEKHETRGRFSFDLTEATGGGSGNAAANPFLNAAATSGGDSSDDDGGSVGASEVDSSGAEAASRNIQIAHGVMMGLAFL